MLDHPAEGARFQEGIATPPPLCQLPAPAAGAERNEGAAAHALEAVEGTCLKLWLVVMVLPEPKAELEPMAGLELGIRLVARLVWALLADAIRNPSCVHRATDGAGLAG
jgi:hypothetical protein